jgi:hypothetical protein
VHGFKDIKQTEIHTAEPLVLEPSAFQVEMAIERLKRNKSPGIDQIPAELIKADDRTFRSETHKLINSIWNKEEMPEEWKQSIIFFYVLLTVHLSIILVINQIYAQNLVL